MNIKQIELHLSDRLGRNVEVTIRGEKEFTFTIDGDYDVNHENQIISWFKQIAVIRFSNSVYDDGVDATFIYIDIV